MPKFSGGRQFIGAIAVLLLAAAAASADTVVKVTSVGALGPNSSINWAQLGGDQTLVPASFGVTSSKGLSATVNLQGANNVVSMVCAEAPPLSTDCSWNSTGFTSGDSLLWTFNAWKGGNGPLTLAFGSGVVGAGALIQSDVPGQFTASIQAFNGATSLGTFTEQSNAEGDALYLGVLDGSGGNITSVVYSLTACAGSCADFGLDGVDLVGSITLTCSATNTGEVGVAFNSGSVTVSGGTAPYTFSIIGTLPVGLTLNTSTGAITGTPTAAGSFTIKVTDSLGTTGTGCAITINLPLQVTCSATNTGEVGVAFNSGSVTVSGGTAPYTFSIIGTLPVGLTLNTSTGAITGTPTAAGSFTIEVTDSLGTTGTGCAITINLPLQVTCSATNTGEVGVAFNSGSVTVSGGTAPYTFSIIGTLPVGLTLNTSTGAITGTPTAAGSFTIQVKDALGVFAATTCPYTIIGGPSINCSATNSGKVNVAFSSQVTASGGTKPYTFSVATGSLPNGLTLNTSTGIITGTPTAAGSFTIQVKDALGVFASSTCPYTIIQPPTISKAFGAGGILVGGTTTVTFTLTNPSVNSVAESGVAFTDTLFGGLQVASMPNPINNCGGTFGGASSGSTSLSFSGGTIPINSSCTVSVNITGISNGTKTNITGAVSSTNGGTGATSNTATITVDQPPTITSPNYTTFTKGIAGSFTVTTTALPVATLSYSPVALALPAGVTFVPNSNGTATISGTPMVSGVFTFFIKASNGVGSPTLQSFSLTVKP